MLQDVERRKTKHGGLGRISIETKIETKMKIEICLDWG